MSKKFDVVIGNPPYQDEATGTRTENPPIYPDFMDAAHTVGDIAVLVTPARFLSHAGGTDRSWNQKMLDDPHFSVAHHTPDAETLFPGTDIKGGIVVTVRDASKRGVPIGTFVKDPELQRVLQKTQLDKHSGRSLQEIFVGSYRHTKELHSDHPEAAGLLAKGHENDVETNVFSRLPFVYHEQEPDDDRDYTPILGLVKNKRVDRWVQSEYLAQPPNHDAFKVAVPAANGSGVLGETLSTPLVLPPGTAVTRSFITMGAFTQEADADACLKYIKTKFARAMLGILKVTQHNKVKVWKHVPLQDFTEDSDIDWIKPIPEIDQQLYAKYGLSDEEIEFIESHVEPME